jgi:hypothetical protein
LRITRSASALTWMDDTVSPLFIQLHKAPCHGVSRPSFCRRRTSSERQLSVVFFPLWFRRPLPIPPIFTPIVLPKSLSKLCRLVNQETDSNHCAVLDCAALWPTKYMSIQATGSGISRRCPVYGYGRHRKPPLISPYTGYTDCTPCPYNGHIEMPMCSHYGQEDAALAWGGFRFGFGLPLGFQFA